MTYNFIGVRNVSLHPVSATGSLRRSFNIVGFQPSLAQHQRCALNCASKLVLFCITTDRCVLGKMGGCWRWCYQTCTCCLSEDERKSVAIDKEIRRILAEQKKKERREIKVLLLGKEKSTANYLFHMQPIGDSWN